MAQLSTFDGIIVSVDQVGLDMDVLAQLQGVKVQDYTGNLKNFTSNVPSAPTSAIFELLNKGC